MTAPRRFGKTTNLSMLKYFLKSEVGYNGVRKLHKYQNNSLFQNLKIVRGDYLDIKEIIYRLSLLENEESLIEDVNRWKEIVKSIDFQNKENILKNHETNQELDNVLQTQVKKYIKDRLKPKFSGIEDFDSLISEYQDARKKREQEEKESASTYESIASKRDVENKKYSNLKEKIEAEINNSSTLKSSLFDYSITGRSLGKYPVIFLTLGNVARQKDGDDKGQDDPNATVENIEKEIRGEIAKAYQEHGYLYRKMLRKEIDVHNRFVDHKLEIRDSDDIKTLEKAMAKIDASADLKKLKVYYNREEGVDLKKACIF